MEAPNPLTQPEDSGENEPPSTPPLTPNSFSYVGQAAIAALEDHDEDYDHLWNYSGDNVLEGAWLQQSPPNSHWGQDASLLAVPRTCTEGANCNTDFQLYRCDTQADCQEHGICRSVQATIKRPGDEPEALCTGHSDRIYDAMYLTLTRARSFVDIANLRPPDGRFLAAIRNGLTYLSHLDTAIQIRILFGDIIGLPDQSVDNVLEDLLSQQHPDSKLTANIGSYRSGSQSWNHAKIITVDGNHLFEGGHNWISDHYLMQSPLHDISLHLGGSAARDAHRFLNQLWSYTCEDQTWWDLFDGGGLSMTRRASMPDTQNDCPPMYEITEKVKLETGTRVVSLARMGEIGTNPSDDAMLAMMDAAQSTIKMSLMDVGPIGIGPITIYPWPQKLLREIGKAMIRGVHVYVVQSSPYSIPGGANITEGFYGIGWTPLDVAEKLQNYLEDHRDMVSDETDIRALICQYFHPAQIRYSDTETWPDGASIGNHAKFFLIDDLAFYVGSQNLYPSNLAEFGLLIDNPAASQKVDIEYWQPMWLHSKKTAASGSDAPHCQL